MIGKINLSGLAFLLFVFLANSAFGQMPGYRAPRYPAVPHITSVDQLMPAARHLVDRVGTGVMRPGYGGIKAGEKVLIAVSERTDFLVIEALRRAFQEKGASVDVYLTNEKPATLDELWSPDANSEVNAAWVNATPGTAPQLGVNMNEDWMAQYDLVPGRDGRTNGRRMMWATREMLAGVAVTYPEEILYAIDRAGWALVRQADRVRITDPEGTDISFTYFPDYWQVVEGISPDVKTTGGGPGTARGEGYTYGRPGASENPLIPGHLMGTPEGIVLEKSDAEGVVAATNSHRGWYPRIQLTVSKNKVTKVEGGGRYGELWRQFLAKFDDKIKYPLYPRTGHSFWMEAAIGIHPKIVRSHNLYESIYMRGASSYERMRAGIIHMGFGNILSENSKWAQEEGLPGMHFHLHLNFPTYEITLRGGKVVKLIDKGHLTVLDDPEIRKVAAKFGDPDQLLTEDWIPALPGVNIPGNYENDFAKDPLAFNKADLRKHYAEELKYKPYP